MNRPATSSLLRVSASVSTSISRHSSTTSRHVVLLRSIHKSSRIIPSSSSSASASASSATPAPEPALLLRSSIKFSIRKSTPLTASSARPYHSARAAAAAATAHFSTSAASQQSKSAQPQQQASEEEEQAPQMDPYEQELYDLLTSQFTPAFLDVRDVSGGCGSMFYINIVSEKFNGMSLVKQHQAVNAVLKDEISKWHGLQLRTKALDKYKK